MNWKRGLAGNLKNNLQRKTAASRQKPLQQEKITEAHQKAKAELLVIQTYQLKVSMDNVKSESDEKCF